MFSGGGGTEREHQHKIDSNACVSAVSCSKWGQVITIKQVDIKQKQESYIKFFHSFSQVKEVAFQKKKVLCKLQRKDPITAPHYFVSNHECQFFEQLIGNIMTVDLANRSFSSLSFFLCIPFHWTYVGKQWTFSGQTT